MSLLWILPVRVTRKSSPLSLSPGENYCLIYIHGFNSSPDSEKAKLTREYCNSINWDGQLVVPELSHVPEEAITTLEKLINQQYPLTIKLIGSSLGGYYATWLAEKFNLCAALINPAVRPYELSQQFLGTNRNPYSGKSFVITQQHISQLRNFETGSLSHPGEIILLAQKGDETLDYRKAVEKYSSSPGIIQDGGSHSFDNYQAMLPVIFDFFREVERDE